MSLKKTASIAACVALLGIIAPNANAVRINKLDTLTESEINQSYYFDWNRNSTYRAALFQAFKTSNLKPPAWLRQGSGPSKPSLMINKSVDTDTLVLLNTCQARDCDENIIYVLFDTKTKTVSAVAKFDGKVSWIGKPDAASKALLSSHSGLN